MCFLNPTQQQEIKIKTYHNRIKCISKQIQKNMLKNQLNNNFNKQN